MSRSVVIDANRIFSELIAANHRLRQTFASEPGTEFLCPKYVLVELFKHKERVAASTGLDEDSLLALLHALLERIRFFDERHQHRELDGGQAALPRRGRKRYGLRGADAGSRW